MLWASRKKTNAKTTVNRKFPIPNEGGLSPSGPAVSELVVIRIHLPFTKFLPTITAAKAA
jgi:hypothetical protein